MSIFKETFPDYVQNQLNARQRIVSQGFVAGNTNDNTNAHGFSPRSDIFLRYTTGKNSWARMSSFVNVNKKIGSKTYSGDQLARKYVLEGGTLFEAKKNSFNLRSGVAKRSGTYGSDIDIGGNRPLGYRPMPGITSISVSNKSAYGSLREAVVRYYCWDKHQLEELELLFMRTGYTVLLEWGWSQYLKSKDLSAIKIENFDNINVINPFDTKTLNSDDAVYNKIDANNKKYDGNYDAMLGYVKNFSWQLMSNGGFECSTTLISRGEIISTLKLSNNNIVSNFTSEVPVNTPVMSQFEQIFYNWMAYINIPDRTAGNTQGQFAGADPTDPLYQITNLTAAKFVRTTLDLTNKFDLKKDSGAKYSDFFTTWRDHNFGGGYLKTGTPDPHLNGYGIEYARLDFIIGLLNLYFNFKDEKGNIISHILVPYDNLCLACPDSVSIDPTVCLIKNSKATRISTIPSSTQADTYGFVPQLRQSENNDVPILFEGMSEFLNSDNRGLIRNIYVSLPKMIEIYRSKMNGNSDVNVIDFLKELLNQISRSLGGINNFQLHTTRSSISIIDVKYLEKGTKNRFTFDLMGLKSICRDVKISSRIFESQSTMIGIAAQSTSNVGDMYSSTQTKLNAGLTDRLIPKKIQGVDKSEADNKKDLELLFTNLAQYLTSKVSGQNLSIAITLPTSEEISNALSALRTYYLQFNKTELGNTAIIPFELEITLDGIAGMVIGQVFKVDTSILPESYSTSKVGFITTGVSHNLQNNDWTTTIKAQICLLD